MIGKGLADTGRTGRYALLDVIRGITLFSMILYHGAWDLVYLYGIRWNWYLGTGAYIWQQSICWTFIFLSGFCWPLGKRPLKRGLVVFGGGLLVTVVTLLIMYQNRIVFGILTFTGSAMLLMILMDKLLKKIAPVAGFWVSILCFVTTRNVNSGSLGFEGIRLLKLPEGLYRGMLMTYLGFPEPGFFSTDYFSVFPWLFLFISGYFACKFFMEKKLFHSSLFQKNCPVFSFMGRHSLLIYLLHQPLLYVLCSLL